MSTEDLLYDSIAQKLLQLKCFNTALEFNQELSERGKFSSKLKDYFINQDITEKINRNIRRTSSIQTLESLDFARFSDDGSYQIEEKIAVLEYELRKANETINLLRGNLNQQSTGGSDLLGASRQSSQHQFQDQQSHQKQLICATNRPIKCYEKRALNYLVNEYLVTQGYRLTSITFADENGDQNFEDWVDVGLSLRRPPDLLTVIRSYNAAPATACTSASPSSTAINRINTTADVAENFRTSLFQEATPEEEIFVSATLAALTQGSRPKSLQIAELDELRKRVSELTRQNVRLGEQVRHFQKELERVIVKGDCDSPDQQQYHDDFQTSGDPFQKGEGTGDDMVRHGGTVEIGTEHSFELNNLDMADRILEKSSKYMSSQFRKALLMTASPLNHEQLPNDRPYSTVTTATESSTSRLTRMAESCEELVDVLAQSLPNIFPNVLVTKREELIPLLLSSSHLHLDTKVRDNLLNLLFNLVKRPDHHQRRIILLSCLKYAQSAGPTRINLELLPQCWEQISHKHPERRLLIAETCGLLAPYVLEDIRESLLLSMLQQLFSEERDSAIRCAVLKSLALIFPFVRDKDKMAVALEIMDQALFQTDDNDVYHVIKDVYLPSLAAWSQNLGLLQSVLTLHFSHRLESEVRDVLGLSRHQPENMELGGTENSTPQIQRSSKILIRGKCERDILICLSCLEALIPFLYHSALITGPYQTITGGSSSLLTSDDGHARTTAPSTNGPDIENPSSNSAELLPQSCRQSKASTLSDIGLITGSTCHYRRLRESFESLVKGEWYLMWNELGFLIQSFLPTLIKCALLIDVDMSSHVLRHYYCSFFQRFVQIFGQNFINTKVEPIFSTAILALAGKESANPTAHNTFTKLIIPVYVAGILEVVNCSSAPPKNDHDIDKEKSSKSIVFLKDLIVSLSLANTSIKSAKASIQELCQYMSQANLPNLTTMLTDLSTHSMASVKVSAARLIPEIVPYVISDHVKLLEDVTKCLCTLSSDIMDIKVRVSGVEGLGSVIQYMPAHIPNDLDDEYCQILERTIAIYYEFFRDLYSRGENQRFAPEVIRVLGRVGTETESRLAREKYVIPCLCHVLSTCNVGTGGPTLSIQDSIKKSGILSALFQALSTLSCCDNSPSVIKDYFLPSLGSLKEDASSFLTPDHERVLDSMIRDQETKVRNVMNRASEPLATSATPSGFLPSNTTNPSKTAQAPYQRKSLHQATQHHPAATPSTSGPMAYNHTHSPTPRDHDDKGSYFGTSTYDTKSQTFEKSSRNISNAHKVETSKLHQLGNIFSRKRS